MKTITINVTRKDIDEGKCGNGSKCAIALAVSRILDGEDVHVTSFSLEFKRLGIGINLPVEAASFISEFDISITPRKDLQPFSFQLDMSDELYNKLFGNREVELGMSAACGSHLSTSSKPTVASAVSGAN